jgi:hypothetical protein
VRPSRLHSSSQTPAAVRWCIFYVAIFAARRAAGSDLDNASMVALPCLYLSTAPNRGAAAARPAAVPRSDRHQGHRHRRHVRRDRRRPRRHDRERPSARWETESVCTASLEPSLSGHRTGPGRGGGCGRPRARRHPHATPHVHVTRHPRDYVRARRSAAARTWKPCATASRASTRRAICALLPKAPRRRKPC